MRTVQLREAKATLSALVEGAARGDTAVITRRGQPRAVIVGLDERNRLRQVPSFGRLEARGKRPVAARHGLVAWYRTVGPASYLVDSNRSLRR